MDIVDFGSNTNYTLYDQVPAAYKPTDAGGDSGIKVQGGSGGKLEIDAASSDTLILVTDDTTITTNDGTYTGASRFGSGVSNTKIVASITVPMLTAAATKNTGM